MSDLQKLAEWHESESQFWLDELDDIQDGDCGDDDMEVPKARFTLHRDTAKILRLLDRVGSECCYTLTETPERGGWPAFESELSLIGPPDLLRQFAERLKQD